ncbi:MAG TPA: hypothetical protein VGA53_03825 [Candidatus Paceibacterota bacterium]
MYQVKILYHAPIPESEYQKHLQLPGVGILAEKALGVMLDQVQGEVGGKPVTQGVSLFYKDEETWKQVEANAQVQAAVADAQRLAGGAENLSVLKGEVQIIKDLVPA